MSSHPELSHLLPHPSTVRASAVRAGIRFLSAPTRQSVNSASGWVCAPVFATYKVARAFALAWSIRLPQGCRGCAVRQIAVGAWAVSVPVQCPTVEQALLKNQLAALVAPSSPWWCPVSWPVVAGGAA